MKSLLRLLLKTQHQQNHSAPAQTEKGMTLVELLVGSIMAFLIITPMLAFVVDMLNTDRREQVKSNTEQDLQAAVDFISQDLSQAIYIYDNNPTTGIPFIKSSLPTPSPEIGTPILVFWKRMQMKNAVSVDTVTKTTPKQCDPKDLTKLCNDTYVRSLIAYYQIKDDRPGIWCQPQGSKCPTRIVRYEIHEGIVKDSSKDDASRYYSYPAEANKGQEVSKGFNPKFDFNKPEQNVTLGSDFPPYDVLVNYIDHNPVDTKTVIDPEECKKALGNPTVTLPGSATPTAVGENTLKVKDPTNSFYACVDTDKNIARVTIRGNSLRRLQDSNVASSTENSAFFPTASVQVQGRGGRGK